MIAVRTFEFLLSEAEGLALHSCGATGSPGAVMSNGRLCWSAPQDHWASLVIDDGVLEIAPSEEFGLATATFWMVFGDGCAPRADCFA